MPNDARTGRRVFGACCLLYGGAYLSRLNIAVALPAIGGALSLSQKQLGLIASGFAVCYAGGQLLNGMIADRVNVKRQLLLGMLFSALCNVLMALCKSYAPLLLCWCLNGAAQSMLWTPLIRVLSGFFTGEERKSVTFKLSFATNIGHILAWFIASRMVEAGRWQLCFLVPALLTAALGVLSVALIPALPVLSAPPPRRRDAPPTRAGKGFIALVFSTGLFFLLICTLCKGFLRDGITTWAPSILLDAGKGTSAATLNLSLVIPVINMGGILLGRSLFCRYRHSAVTLLGLIMLSCCAVIAPLCLFTIASAPVIVLLLGLLCALMNAASPLLSTYIPMCYDRAGRVGTVTGLMDCCLYIGSALSGAVTGGMRSHGGWQTIFILWLIMACACALFALIARRRFSAFIEKEQPDANALHG